VSVWAASKAILTRCRCLHSPLLSLLSPLKRRATPPSPSRASTSSCACTTTPPCTKTHTQHRLPPLYDILTLGWSLGQGRGRIAQSNSVGAELRHGRHHCELAAVVLFCPPLFLVSVRAILGLPLALGMTLPRVVVSLEQNTTTTVATLIALCHRARGQLG
jgi:hypothetical protein